MNVLIVEDSDTTLLLLTLVAKERGHDVMTARDVEAALKLIKNSDFPLIITDWHLPGMSGIDLCRLIRALPNGDAPFVLLQTSRTGHEDVGAGLAAGADDYLPKPYTHPTLHTRFLVAERQVKQREEKTAALRERETLRQQLALADRLTSVGTLAAGVAHEINNPLAYTMNNIHFSIELLRALRPELAGQSFSTLFQRFGVDDPVGAAIEALVDAQHGSERVRNIVSQLRHFSRDDGAKLEQVSVQEVIEGALTLVANEIRHRATLDVQYEPTGPVLANRSKLGQVIVNLLVNAAQAIEGNANQNRISVRTRSVKGDIEIEIADTGKGIAPENLPRIFEPFFTTKEVGEGTGLGLSICHGFISSFGGTIQAKSEGRGATFKIMLPCSNKTSEVEPSGPSVQTEAPPPETVESRRARLLIVDDEPAIGRSLTRIFNQSHDVTAVSDAREALAMLDAGREFDLILCDIMMPQMTGMDFYTEFSLRKEDPSKLVFITGGAFTPNARQFLDTVQNDRLMKPLDIRALSQLLDRRLKSN